MQMPEVTCLYTSSFPYTIAADDIQSAAEGTLFVPLESWSSHQKKELDHRGITGLLLKTDDELNKLPCGLSDIPCIAIEFPSFADGRGFSLAKLIRDRCHYNGDLIAMGDFLPDQMHYLVRCGFNQFLLPDHLPVTTAESCINAFQEAYQASWHNPSPLFRRQ